MNNYIVTCFTDYKFLVWLNGKVVAAFSRIELANAWIDRHTVKEANA